MLNKPGSIWLSASVFVAVLLAVSPAWSLSEAWAARGTTIERYGLDSAFLGSFGIAPAAKSMAVVGSEVWVGGSDTKILRIAFDQTLLGTFGENAPGGDVGAIAVVGSEVWAARESTTIERYGLDSTFLGSFGIAPFAKSMAVVGSEVWVGGSDTKILRIAFDQTLLGTFGENAPGGDVGAIAVVGSEVWAARGTTIERYGLDSAFLGSFGIAPAAKSMAVVGSEVWVGGSDTKILRIAFDQTLLGTFGENAPGGDVGAIAVTYPNLPCDDGLDNDGDNLIDLQDPACKDSSWPRENAQCQDGLDNDNNDGIDFDGGASIFGQMIEPPDPQCSSFWDDREATNPPPTCGIGPELVLLTPLLMLAHRRRRGRR